MPGLNRLRVCLNWFLGLKPKGSASPVVRNEMSLLLRDHAGVVGCYGVGELCEFPGNRGVLVEVVKGGVLDGAGFPDYSGGLQEGPDARYRGGVNAGVLCDF